MPTHTPTSTQEARPASRPNAERRYEATHSDGAAAVAYAGCPQYKARKGALCIRHDGERTNYVHAKRLARRDAS